MELDKDLAARQEARELAREAERAQHILADFPQEKLDAIVESIARAFAAEAKPLAELAVQETGFGNVADKITKNRFASEEVAKAVRGMKTVGLLRRRAEEQLWEIGVPVGVIAAIVPSTNPTSTVCYKAMIALKSGNPIVFSPHPKAAGCTRRAAQIVAQAAEEAGAPRGSVACLSIPAMAGCQELMGAEQVKLILATGGPAMVKAAYSSGKPAIGVGAGNGPAYIHHSADVSQALKCIARSKTFDNGTVCASEQSIIVERSMESRVVEEAKKQGFYFLTPEEAGKLAKILFRPNGALNPEVVGKPAARLAELAGFSVPASAKILVAREREAGIAYPYSMEKLCPVLAFYVMDSEDAVLQKCIEILDFEGSGHTFAMHAEDETVIRKFADKIPVSRFLVNTPAALGGIGATTGLFPALTLGCGAVGGSSSSNNISPLDLINIRRVAWGTEEPKEKEVHNPELVELLTQKILERLEH
ncbi:MAG: acetaldehyde dehydrogenase (acetylating) [Faecousia sp.]